MSCNLVYTLDVVVKKDFKNNFSMFSFQMNLQIRISKFIPNVPFGHLSLDCFRSVIHMKVVREL